MIDALPRPMRRSLAEAVKSKSIAKSAEQIADEIHASYPFHPSVKHVIALFKENESYRQTRGLMQFVSKMIKSVWAATDQRCLPHRMSASGPQPHRRPRRDQPDREPAGRDRHDIAAQRLCGCGDRGRQARH